MLYFSQVNLCCTLKIWRAQINYLEIEIDQVLTELSLHFKKLSSDEIKDLFLVLSDTFFSHKKPTLLLSALKKKRGSHDPGFWKKISSLKDFENPIIIVSDYRTHGWQLDSVQDIQTLLGETTGYPFWLVDSKFRSIIYADDDDCISEA